MSESKYNLSTLKFSRLAMLGAMKELSDEQLNKIPDGFRNNIIWNLAHSICSTDSMCYRASGNPLNVTKEQIDAYKRGSQPTGPISSEEIKYWKDLALTSIDQMQKDLDSGLFNNYHAFDITPFYKINSINDALDFSTYHEGSHYGYILALRKKV